MYHLPVSHCVHEQCPVHHIYIIGALAIAVVVTTELETATVQASLLLRCGDIEVNPGPLRKEGEIDD